MNSPIKKRSHIFLLILFSNMLFFCTYLSIGFIDYALDINELIWKITGMLLLPSILGVLIALILSDYRHFALLSHLKYRKFIRAILLSFMLIHIALNVGIAFAFATSLGLPMDLYKYLNFTQNNILFITSMYFIVSLIFIQSSSQKI